MTGADRRRARGLVAAAGLVVLALLSVPAVDALGDLTQTRPDPVDRSRASVLVFDVRTHAYDGPLDEAAAAVWGVCAGTVGGEVHGRRIDQVAEARFQVLVAPAIGPRGTQRMRGCLNDAVVDRVHSSFVSIDEVAAP